MWVRRAKIGSLVVLVGLYSPLAIAQFTYDFDGMADEDPQPLDPTDWMTSENWGEDGFDPLAPAPLVPNFTTRVEIDSARYGTNAPVIGPEDEAQAQQVRIGRFGGPGELTMTGGTLDLADHCSVAPFRCGDDTDPNTRFRVGNADVLLPENRHPGTFNMSGGTLTADTVWIGSGSHGAVNMSGGLITTRSNFYFDWTSDLTYDTNSVLNMTGGTIHVGTTFALKGNLRMYRLSSLNLDGGEILVDGAAELGTDYLLNPLYMQTPNVTVSITDGLLESKSFLRIGGSITLSGGILRANSFNETDSLGTIEINAGGLLQFETAMESVAAVQGYINSGFFTTSEASPLMIQIVDVDGVDFTQVSAQAPGLLGDYNQDGNVDAADYVLWRKSDGTNNLLPNDGGLGTPIRSEHYDFWVENFGNTSGGGTLATAVPEPASWICGLVALVAVILARRSN